MGLSNPRVSPLGLDNRNYLNNPGAENWQRGTTNATVSNNTYYPDQWIVTHNSTSIQVQKLASPTGCNSRYCLYFVNPSLSRAGFSQVLENSVAKALRGQTIRFQAKVLGTNAVSVRLAIIEWTGTADSLGTGRDVVGNWSSTSYVTGAFFKSTTTTVAGVSASTAINTTTPVDVSVTAQISSSANNIIVLMWQDTTSLANVGVYFADLGLYTGVTPRTWTPPDPDSDLNACYRHFVSATAMYLGLAYGGNALYSWGPYFFPTPMRTTPSASNLACGVNGGSAGTITPSSLTPIGVTFQNSSNNWTALAIVNLTTGYFSAEL